MDRLEHFLRGANGIVRAAERCSKRFGLAVPVAFIGFMLILPANAQDVAPRGFDLVPASDAVADEAFSSTLAGGERVRQELNHVVVWFADPADDFCADIAGILTPFDGDGQARAAALSSKNSLPGAPLP